MTDISNNQINITSDISNNSETPKFFATLTTPELMKKQQIDVTKRELEKLMNEIKNKNK